MIEFVGSGAPVAPEQQLQVLFILQEALSSVRKHAQASEVKVRVDNERDFTLSIAGDGQEFSMDTARGKGDSHVDLRIMQERAERPSAQLDIQSTPSKGTTIVFHLLRQERLVA